MIPVWGWVIFNIFIFILLALDLFVLNKHDEVVSLRKALMLTALWVTLSLLFCLGIYLYEPLGPAYAGEFLTGYLIEQALSVDNLFVILMLFTYFRTPTAYQHKALFWGILGAIFFRILFILTGVALLERFHFMVYLLGAFLIFTSINMLVSKGEPSASGENLITRLVKKLVPVTNKYHGSNFFIKEEGKRFATPLFLVVVVIETTDILFALDSIPAILAISKHPFIVYSSNIFAILGLRSLYFALAGIIACSST